MAVVMPKISTTATEPMIMLLTLFSIIFEEIIATIFEIFSVISEVIATTFETIFLNNNSNFLINFSP